MLDLTSSMGDWITEAKRKFTDVVLKLQPMYAHIPGGIRVGFVGYRDYDDKQRFLVAAPSVDHAAVLRTLATVQVTGGGDIPEDVAGGFDQIAKLSLRSSATRLIVHIADAPPHGCPKYHNYCSYDAFPAGDKFGLDPDTQLADFARAGVEYVLLDAGEVGTSTMADKFTAAFNNAVGRTARLATNAMQLRMMPRRRRAAWATARTNLST